MKTKLILPQNTYFLKYMLFLLFAQLFILYSCEKENEREKKLIATISANEAMAGVDVLTFTDQSLGVTSRTWTFPGGEPATSDKPEVRVVFSEEGDIVVTLRVVYYDGTEETKEFPITIVSQKKLVGIPSANEAIEGLDTLRFTDLSLGVTSRIWTFPGGEPATSDEREVSVVFNEVGDVVVTLRVVYYDGTEETKEFPITITPPPVPPLIADFTPSATRIKVGETVTFTDASTGGPTAWSWEFEGGTPATSTEQNPTVEFNVNKAINVKLTITRESDGMTATVEKNDLVQVGPPELMFNGDFETGNIINWQTWAIPEQKGFTLAIEAGGANGTAYSASFNYKSSWEFAEAFSRDKDPSNTISLENGRNYTVSLYAKASESGVSTLTCRVVNWLAVWSTSLGGRVPEDYSPYEPISGTSFPLTLTTDWQHVSFVVSIPDDGKSRSNAYPYLKFIAETNVKIYFDEVSFKIVE